MNIFKLITFYNIRIYTIKKATSLLFFIYLLKINFLQNYYSLNELIWQDGFLIDFLQKKIIDNWIKKFLINSSYLFNERLVFEKIIKFYLNLIIWPGHKFFIFEINNIINLFFILLLSFFLFFIFSILFYFIFLMF